MSAVLDPAQDASDDPIALARSLSKRAAPEGAPADEKAQTDLLLAQLQRDRLVSAAFAPAFGGRGLPVRDAARVTAELARQSGSLGLTYAMHMSQAYTLARHAPPTPFFEALQRSLVDREALIASGTSEKGVGGDIFGSLCQVEADADGELMVVKESPNISYLDHAALILVSAMRPRPDGRKPLQVLAAVERDRIELRPGRQAGFIGMRGILNRPYGLTARFGEAAIFPEPYPVIARDTMTPVIHILWAALWSGISGHALEKARTFLAQDGGDDPQAAAAMACDLSRLVDKHHQMNALIRDAIADDARTAAGAAGGLGLAGTARVKRLKVTCGNLLQEICLGALSLVGIRGYAEGGPYSLSAPLRDALSAQVMISNYRLTAANAKVERFIDEAL
jgi:acyl-CoA dehydrogenase